MGIEVKIFGDYDLDLDRSYGALDEFMEVPGLKGWLDPQAQLLYLDQIRDLATEVRDRADLFILCGVGGSYLGARAAIQALVPAYGRDMEIIYTGNSLNPNEIQEILDYIGGKSLYLNPISKSGSTLETNIAFNIFEDYIEKNFVDSRDRIIITTGNVEGPLARQARLKAYRTLPVPEDMGGRYSVMSPVGLFPMAVAGIDIEAFLAGGQEGADLYLLKDPSNPALVYSAFRSLMYESGKDIEALVSYYQSLEGLGQWWRQLFAESQGKAGKGLYPSSLTFTRDLHSLGQLVQDGRRNIFETVIGIKESDQDLSLDQMGQAEAFTSHSLAEINQIARQAAASAHVDGGCPNLLIDIDRLDAHNLGQLMYFFMVSCAINSYELGVNPFDQPGVEAYKTNIKKRLVR